MFSTTYADSEIVDWQEADSSIILAESPLSVVSCSFRNNKGAPDKAVIESWYGALVRLEDVEFTGTTGGLLFNDDPVYNSQNGVFFAPPGSDFTVRISLPQDSPQGSGNGVRSTRPLSEAPDRFLTLQDAEFSAVQDV